MLKWLIPVVIALFLFNGLERSLRKFGFGRLPGDFSVRVLGRSYYIPLTSTLLFTALVWLIASLL